MREFEYNFQEGLKRGLRPDKGNPTNNEFLTQCFNVKPSGLGIVPYEPLITPLSGVDLSWPFPQLLIGQLYKLLCRGTEIYTLDSNWGTSLKCTTTQNEIWDWADFGAYVVLTNGLKLVISNPATGDFTASDSLSTMPLFSTCCNFKGRLVGGNIKSSWYDCGSNSVIWSDIGSANCLPGQDNRNQAGYRNMNWHGQVLRVKRLGDVVIVYGDSGISALVPQKQYFGLKELHGGGIKWKGAVGGDENVHAFVDLSGYLWVLDKTLKLERIGYQEFLSPLSNPMVSYRSDLGEFLISDKSRCFVFTKYGMGECHQITTSCGVSSGIAYGMCKDTKDYTAQITSDTFDFKVRSMKTVEWLEFDAIQNASMYAAVDYRYDKKGTFATSPWKVLNKEGVARICMTAVDFRLKLKTYIAPGIDLAMEDGSLIVLESGEELATEGSGDERYDTFSISRINVKVKASDKRFVVRGPYQRSIQDAT